MKLKFTNRKIIKRKFRSNCPHHSYRLTSIIQSLEQKINALKIANKELKSSYEMAELRNKKHEERQREIITKLSHQQVANQQLEYEIKKCSE